ncbi:hypothetical protein PsYK624_067300 [Phanerochaete sordida]|uniref:Uncharacterized protein n=1 Tax=Phanerochaete sordida TaxID=48140 RepID=A0A9P3G9C3_9APHY|nr:hypothetical protein PsYK624_067300 [Phanerochaete sordida]
MDLIRLAGAPSDYRTVHQIPGLSVAERRELKQCMDSACHKHLDLRRLWRHQTAQAKAALTREATRKCKLLLRYLDQWPVEALAAQFLRDARARRNRRRRGAGRTNGDWDYRAPRTGHGASARRAAAASSSRPNAGDGAESEDETVWASSEETPAAAAQRAPSGGVTGRDAVRRTGRDRRGQESPKTSGRPSAGELAYSEGDVNSVDENARMDAGNEEATASSAGRVAFSARARSSERLVLGPADTVYIVSPQDVPRPAYLPDSGTDASMPQRSPPPRASAGSASTRVRGESAPATSSAENEAPPSVPSERSGSDHALGDGAPRAPEAASPNNQSEILASRSSVEAAQPVRARSPSSTVAPSNSATSEPGHPFIRAFLHDISPSLASTGAVERFAATGVVTREDLDMFALLSREGQLETLREDVGLSVVHARLVREALERV